MSFYLVSRFEAVQNLPLDLRELNVVRQLLEIVELLVRALQERLLVLLLPQEQLRPTEIRSSNFVGISQQSPFQNNSCAYSFFPSSSSFLANNLSFSITALTRFWYFFSSSLCFFNFWSILFNKRLKNFKYTYQECS